VHRVCVAVPILPQQGYAQRKREKVIAMATKATGGCACGAIRYECAGEPILAGSCYCRDCQRSSGTHSASGMYVPASAVTITGEPRYYAVTGESGKKISRGFCATCGSPLFFKADAFPKAIGIRPASLDDPSIFKPGVSVYTSSAPAWATFSERVPKFPKMPPMN